VTVVTTVVNVPPMYAILSFVACTWPSIVTIMIRPLAIHAILLMVVNTHLLLMKIKEDMPRKVFFDNLFNKLHV